MLFSGLPQFLYLPSPNVPCTGGAIFRLNRKAGGGAANGSPEVCGSLHAAGSWVMACYFLKFQSVFTGHGARATAIAEAARSKAAR
jgi:hypothetical protein